MFEADGTDVNGIGAIGGLGLEPAGGAIPLTGTNDPLTGGMSPEVLAVPTLGAENYDTTVWPLDSAANGPPPIEEDGPIEGSPSSVDPLMGVVADGQGEPSISGLMDEAVKIAQSGLQELAAGPDLAEKLTEAFGENGSKKAVEEVTPDWVTGDFSGLPDLKVVSSAEIDGANGAYAEATDTIYISGEFLVENISSPQAVAGVLLEEIGHHVDARINVVDAVGDEGEIFSAVVQGEELSESYLAAVRGEDDTAVVTIDGQTLTIEKDDFFETASSIGSIRGTTRNDVGNGDDNDYYLLSVESRSNVNISLSNLSDDIDVQLFSESRNQIDYSNNSGSSGESINQVLEAGTYYVRVYPYEAASSNYDLSWSVDPLGGTSETQTSSNDEWVSYTVQWGDTLWDIAQRTTGDPYRYGDIANYNGIDPNAVLNTGVEIWVPGNNSTGTTVETTTENSDEWVRYTVQWGDTLWDIAQRTTGDPYRYGDIANYNGIDPNAILNTGVEIWVPSNNSTGITVETTTGTGSSSETSYGGGVEFIETFAEPRTREVDRDPDAFVRQDWPDSYEITLDRVGGQGYIQNNLETWIVIHGWNDWPTGDGLTNAADLASVIERYGDGNRQVLTLDWSGMANRGRNQTDDLHDATVWIEEVAEATVEQLNEWNFDRNNINLVGHSLGAYVAYEISEQLGGVNNLVALDPAASTQDGYDIDQVDFSDHSRWSWSLKSSWAGNYNTASTAHEFFEVDFGLTLPTESHGAVKQLWAHMLGNQNGEISRHFGLEDMNGYGKPWFIDYGPGLEAEIDARDVLGFGSNGFGGTLGSIWVPDKLLPAGGTSIAETTNNFEGGGMMIGS